MKLMALDGNSIINRAFYGVRQLTAPDGTPTNAVYGFLTILQKLVAEETPDALCVMFDLPAPTFRHELYDSYKAHRTGMPDELAVQMPLMREVLDAMNIARRELAGWEADDLLGAVARRCEDAGWDCVLVTGDKDSLQLITDKTRVRHVKTRMGQTETKDYTAAAFLEEYGFEPKKLVDLKALMGDSSDNIPGVKGVGEKTAMELVRRFGGIGDIFAELDTLDVKDAVRKKLEAGKEDVKLSYELAKIRCDAPLELAPEGLVRRDYDNDTLFEIFKRLGFMKLTEKFGLRPPSGATAVKAELKVVDIITQEDAKRLLDNANNAEIASVRFGTGFCAAAILVESEVFIVRDGVTENYNSVLSGLLNGRIKKAGHDVKDILRACIERGLETDGWVFDAALAAYLISPTDSSFELGRISKRYCGYDPSSSDTNGQMTLLSDKDERAALAEEAYAIGQLYAVLSDKLSEMGLSKLYNEIELPLCSVLAEMEHTGFLVDREALLKYGQTLSKGIAETEKQIFELAGETFNVNSPKQLGMILFEKLMLPSPKKTKTGYSTNVDVLEQLLDKHPIIRLIMDYRELAKLKSTYADGLLKVIADDGRIHTRFQMTVTATGRLSSAEPNLQNIPIRKETGGELRRMFVAKDGNMLVDADYSQIELRLLAHIAGDPVMRAAFENGEDIHTVTASQVFGVQPGDVTPLMRSRAKAVNFGIVYGISAFSLARDIGVSAQEAKMYIDAYLDKYAGVRRYMTEIVEKAKEDGYVATLFGRRRSLPELKSPKFTERSFGERVALNMPIQGTAADIMKIAMINVHRRLKDAGLSAKLILQVHDELIVECPEHEADAAAIILREEMESAAELSIPLIAETHAGKSWLDAK